MRSLLCLLAAAALPAAAQTTPPQVPVLDAAAITRVCDEGLAKARAMIAAMEAKPGPAGYFEELNELQIAVEEVSHPVSVMGSLQPDKAARDAADPCLQKYTALFTDIFQSEKLYARVRAVQTSNPRDAKLRRNLLEGFEDSGVSLPADKRARAKAIAARLEELRQAFERTLREDATAVRVTAAELDGVPESFRKNLKPEADGTFVVKLTPVSFDAIMVNARSEDVRRRTYLGWVRRGGEGNLKALEEAFALRKELAALHGQPTYAHYIQRRRMVGSPDVVNKFLAEVKATVADVEKGELAILAEFKARELKTAPAQTRINRWDTNYYLDKVRNERFAVDEEKLRRYFPTPKALEYALLISETLYGIKFREGKAPTWHPDVRYFDIYDAASGRYIANIYVDLYPREGKRNGAWASGVRRASVLAQRTPTSVLVTNFNREGLSHRELETLLHEFGHVLHGVLSQAYYVSQAGTAVKRDFVEAPSQMFEEWVRREQALALFRKVCAECPVLGSDEIKRIDAARRFGQGIQYSGQHLLASFDMSMSTNPEPPMAAWKRLESQTVLGSPEGTLRPASFHHVAGSGYAAGYYGYMWSEVIGLDLLSQFAKDLLDPKVGARYRETILSQGGQVEEMEMVRKFLGREPSNEAFLAEISGKR